MYWSVNFWMQVIRSLTFRKVPRRIALCVMMPNQISTWFSQEAYVGVQAARRGGQTCRCRRLVVAELFARPTGLSATARSVEADSEVVQDDLSMVSAYRTLALGLGQADTALSRTRRRIERLQVDAFQNLACSATKKSSTYPNGPTKL